MSKRVVIALAAGIVVAVVAVAFWPGEKEPEYQGKKLSEWLATQGNDDQGQAKTEAAEGLVAIRNIGTNAVPGS